MTPEMTSQNDEVRAFLDDLKKQGSIYDYRVDDEGICRIRPVPALRRIKIDETKFPIDVTPPKDDTVNGTAK